MLAKLTSVGGAAALAAVIGCGVAGAAGAATVGPTRVGPHQFFVGEVNGMFNHPTVKVACPGPAGTTGRALPGQTIEVSSPPVVFVNSGNTGANGKRIIATIGPASTAAGGSVTFTHYDKTKEFPTTVPVPCSGTGLISFAPAPTGAGAKPFTLTVTYANVATPPG